MIDELIARIVSSRLNLLFTNRYLLSFVIFILSLLAVFMIMLIVKTYIKRLTRKTKTKVDDLILKHTKKPFFYLLLLFGLTLSLKVLQLPVKIDHYTSISIESLQFWLFIMILSRSVDILLVNWGELFSKRTKSRVEDILPLIRKFSKVSFYLIGGLTILYFWGINVTGFIAGLGIAGLAISFALKDSLSNIFGGVSLILDKTFKVGDKIKLDSGEIGIIHDIGLRSTKLKTFDNEIITIPNGYLANIKIQNYALPNEKVRVRAKFGVEYGNDIGHIKKIISSSAKRLTSISKDIEPEVIFLEMSDFALIFECHVWVDSYKKAYDTKLELTQLIYKTLEKNKIGIPYPTSTIYLKK